MSTIFDHLRKIIGLSLALILSAGLFATPKLTISVRANALEEFFNKMPGMFDIVDTDDEREELDALNRQIHVSVTGTGFCNQSGGSYTWMLKDEQSINTKLRKAQNTIQNIGTHHMDADILGVEMVVDKLEEKKKKTLERYFSVDDLQVLIDTASHYGVGLRIKIKPGTWSRKILDIHMTADPVKCQVITRGGTSLKRTIESNEDGGFIIMNRVMD